VTLGAVTAVCALSPIAYYASTRLYDKGTWISLLETAGLLAIPVAVAWLFRPRQGGRVGRRLT
jgi:hypothetical protein